ncbi:hypothetical protein [Patulibacter americanus]|uniref:hypothetical protein n=1 Tax=Patulibacter americanus TaxID=588672 RepID=UPI0003B4982B|nr:hypothetical protein [Patulibacter americanus]
MAFGSGALRVAALVEALTLAALLLNVATVHAAPVSAFLGPLHGAAYLASIALVLTTPGAPRGARLRVLIPGVGGLLAQRRL